MTWELFLTSALIALVTSAAVVYTTAFFLRRMKSWPPAVAWSWRFFAPLVLFLFILIMRYRPGVRQFLTESGFDPWSRVVVVFSATWFLLSVIRVGKSYLWRVFDISGEDNLENRMRQTQLQFIEKMLVILLVVLSGGSVLLSFDSVSQFGTSLLASAGVATVVIGIASQKIVANLLAGFQIAFSQPLRIDDAVVIDGEWGWVEEITLTYVVVRLWDLRRLIVPLSRLLDQPFQNWTRQESKIIGTVFLHVAYTVDVNEIRDELDRLLATTPLWDGDTKVVQVTESHVHTMEVRILVSARSSSRAFDLRCHVREGLIRYLANKAPHQIGQMRVSLDRETKEPLI